MHLCKSTQCPFYAVGRTEQKPNSLSVSCGRPDLVVVTYKRTANSSEVYNSRKFLCLKLIFVTNTLSDTFDIMCLMPISNLLKENLDYTYCCVIRSNAIAMKYFLLVAVMLMECGGKGHARRRRPRVCTSP